MYPVCGVEDAPPGARASRPHHVRHNLGPLRHSDRPGTAPLVCFGLTVEVAADWLATFSTRPPSSKPCRHLSSVPPRPGEGLPNRKLYRQGGGPLAEKRRTRGIPTLPEATARVLEQKQAGWRNPNQPASGCRA